MDIVMIEPTEYNKKMKEIEALPERKQRQPPTGQARNEESTHLSQREAVELASM